MTPLKVFVVEDSAVIRENLIAALEEMAPVQVVGSAAGERVALNWLKDHDPEVQMVIIDIFLKEGSGLGVLRGAHQLPTPKTLVVLSNYATPDMRRRCLELGASRVFDKSSEIDALVQYCRDVAQPGADAPHIRAG